MVEKYVPRQKDIVFLDFGPIIGHEQTGYRPAVVVSNDIFNKNTKMAMVCPITSNIKSFPTHYLLNSTKVVNGSVLCEHIRSVDYETSNFKFVEKIDNKDFENILCLLQACVEN